MSKNDFQTDLKKHFLETIQTWRFWEKDESLALCVSGGVDSIVMLHAILDLPKNIRPKPVVFHFDHALRGKQSAGEALFVKKICAKWSVPFYADKAKLKDWKYKNNLHERARTMRYEYFFKQAVQLGIKKILTAHQANDQAETFLMHWIQGAGLKGLSGIPFVREHVWKEGLESGQKFSLVRPLLLSSRQSIEAYAKTHRLKYCKDPSNRDSKYLRTRLRRLILEIQKENPQFIERAAKNSLTLQEDERWLNEATEAAFYEGVERLGENWGCSHVFFQGLPRALQTRLIQKIVYEICEESLSFDRIVSMIRFLETSEKERVQKTFMLPGVRLKKEKTFFVFIKSE